MWSLIGQTLLLLVVGTITRSICIIYIEFSWLLKENEKREERRGERKRREGKRGEEKKEEMRFRVEFWGREEKKEEMKFRVEIWGIYRRNKKI